MKEKVYQLIEKIINNADKIDEVVRSGLEYYFTYSGHAFSLLRKDQPDAATGSRYSFFLYPKFKGDLAKLAAEFEVTMVDTPITAIDEVTFPSAYRAVFPSLYLILEIKATGADQVIDKLLSE